MTLETRYLPKPDELLEFCDIDGTLVDRDYRITDSGIFETIEEAQSSGWIIGLGSDTPHQVIAAYRFRFSMNGPIVAEKKSVVEYSSRPLRSR